MPRRRTILTRPTCVACRATAFGQRCATDRQHPRVSRQPGRQRSPLPRDGSWWAQARDGPGAPKSGRRSPAVSNKPPGRRRGRGGRRRPRQPAARRQVLEAAALDDDRRRADGVRPCQTLFLPYWRPTSHWRFVVRPDGTFFRIGNADGSFDNHTKEELLRYDQRDKDPALPGNHARAHDAASPCC